MNPTLSLPFNDKHLGIPQLTFAIVSIFRQECIALFIKGIYGIEQSCQIIIDGATPYKGITIGIGRYLGSVNEQFFQPFFRENFGEVATQLSCNLPGFGLFLDSPQGS